MNINDSTKPGSESPCSQGRLAGEIETGLRVVVKDHLGNDVPLSSLPYAILATDAGGRVRIADGGEDHPIYLTPAELPSQAQAEFLVLYRQTSKSPLQIRRAGQSLLEAIAETHVESLLETAIEDRIAEAIAGRITALIDAKVEASGAEQYRLGDWKMRLDDAPQPHWFRSGEKFARQVYPDLYELLGTDVVPDFRGRFLRQLVPGVDDPGSTSEFCPGSECDQADELRWVNVDWMIYGGIPATCSEIADE